MPDDNSAQKALLMESSGNSPGARLSTLLSTVGMTKTDFAELVGVTPSYISQVCSDRKPPSGKIVEVVQEQFGVDEDWLLRGGELQVRSGYIASRESGTPRGPSIRAPAVPERTSLAERAQQLSEELAALSKSLKHREHLHRLLDMALDSGGGRIGPHVQQYLETFIVLHEAHKQELKNLSQQDDDPTELQ